MGSQLSSMWKEADLIKDDSEDKTTPIQQQGKPRNKQLERTAVCLAQDPRSPPNHGTEIDRTPIQFSGEGKENMDTPVAPKTVLAFDPRSPGIERSPIVVTAEDGTPTVKNKTSFKNRLKALQRNE